MLIRGWRSRPLTVDALPAFVQKQRRVAGPRMQFGQRVRNQGAVRVIPRAGADAVARVDRLVIGRSIAFDAQVRAPGAATLPNGRGQPLTRCVRSGESAQIAGGRGLAGDEEAKPLLESAESSRPVEEDSPCPFLQCPVLDHTFSWCSAVRRYIKSL